MKKIIIIVLCLCVFEANSQIYVENMNRMILTGSLRTEGNLLLPVRWAKVELKGYDKVVHADGTGYFVVDGKGLTITSASSEVVLVISAEGYETKEFLVSLGQIELGVLFMKMNFKDMDPITVNDLMPDTPENGSATIESIGANAIFRSDDPLSKSSNYQLGMHGYKMRGYDRRNTEIYLNGASLNDPETGYALTGLLNRFINISKKNSGTTSLIDGKPFYGGIGGYGNIETNPLLMTPRAKVSYSFGNSLYTHSLEASYSTGKMASDWALAFLLSGRIGGGFVDGSDYEGFSYMFSVGKAIDDFHTISFMLAGAPTKRGGINYSTQNVYEQNKNNYFNSALGYYRNNNPKNSRQNIEHQPLFVASHEWEGEISSLKTSLLLSSGRRSEGGLNRNDEQPVWNGFQDPFFSSKHVLWDSIYSENQRLGRSKYILDANTNDRTMISLNSVYDLFEWGRLETTAGVEAKLYFGRYYNKVSDLLGGNHWLNIDKFAAPPANPDFYQFDILLPDRKISGDGMFGHDYSIRHQSYKLWNVWRYYMSALKFSLGGSASYLTHGYEGNVKNGKVPESGIKTPDKKFFNFSGKAGVAYKLNKKSHIEANAMYSYRAPLFSDTYLSPRISGDLLPNLKNEKILATELNYVSSTQLLDLRLSGYFTMFKNRSVVRSYYNDLHASRLIMGLTGLNSLHAGGEANAKVSINQEFKFDFAAAYGIYKYTSDPKIRLMQENINETLTSDTARMKGLFVGNAPQLAVSAGGMYKSPLDFWTGLNLSYSGINYAEENPFALAYGNSAPNSDEQTKLTGALTVNLYGGYSFVFGKKNKNALSLNFNIQNLLNTQKGVLGAYRPFGMDANDLRYAYMYGRTMYLMLRFWF